MYQNTIPSKLKVVWLDLINVNSATILFSCFIQGEVGARPREADRLGRNHEKSPKTKRQLQGAQGLISISLRLTESKQLH